MVAYLLSRLVVLVFGTLYPAYYSYKAVKSRNVKEYVKWMMYWIVFAIFSCVETVADIFASILPFYYEIKILFIFWLISPWTKGATYLYRKCIHPTLSRKEQEIDEYINQASTRGYEALKRVGKNGMTLAANAVMTSAIKGQTSLLDQLKTYSGIAAIAAATATTEQEQVTQRTLEGEDITDQGSKVTKIEEAELQRSALLTPELHDLDYGGSTHGSLLQSLDRLDNRLREEREQEQHITNEWGHKDIEPDNDDWDRRMEMEDRADKDWDSVIMQDQYQAPPQPKPRAKPRSPPRRKPIPPSPPAEFDSEGSDVERPATLRRSTSMRSSTRSSRYSSNENLASSRGRYASTENLSRRSSRKAEMMGRAIRHSTRQSTTKDGSERKSSRPK